MIGYQCSPSAQSPLSRAPSASSTSNQADQAPGNNSNKYQTATNKTLASQMASSSSASIITAAQAVSPAPTASTTMAMSLGESQLGSIMIKREPGQAGSAATAAECAATAAAVAVLSSLSSHMNLISQSSGANNSGGPNINSSSVVNMNHESVKKNMNSPQQQVSHTAITRTGSTTSGSPPNSNGLSSVSPRLTLGSQSTAAISPGYHSAAPSPSSSVASPVSSSSNSSPSAASSSSSSGIGSGSSSAALSLASSTSSSSSSTSSLCSSANSSSVSPSFSRSPLSPNLLDYYPEINQDGLGLSWYHDANNRAKLNAALMTNKLVVAGDISLAEMSRYPVPIMARPPLGVSDITLESWLQEVVNSRPQRGIKLTFTSTRTVEPAFRVLARHAEHIRGPLILSADILNRPNGPGSAHPSGGKSGRQQQQQQQQLAQQQQPVDAWTFLMLCRTRFPKCIISIGWCSALNSSSASGGGSGSPIGSSGGHQMSGLPSWALAAAAANGTGGGLEPPLGMGGSCAMADSSSSSLHSSADSMFELDIMDTHPVMSSLPAALSAHHQLVAHHHLGHLQHLNHQHRIHQHLHPYPLVQQANGGNQGAGHHSNNRLMGHHNHHNHHHHHHHHHASLTHHILSSSGSLNSSSGNSSSSPSPTSPIGHLMGSPHQTVPTNLSMGASGKCSSNSSSSASSSSAADSTEQLFLSTSADLKSPMSSGKAGSGQANAAAAAAAMAAAAVVAASTFHQQNNHSNNNQQLPLNLNINEADQQLSSSAAASSLSNLAKKIQSYQSINQLNLCQQTAANNHHNHHHQHEALAAKLFNNSGSSQHVSKKAALTSCGSNAPSPQSSSPRHQQQPHAASATSGGASNLLLKTTSGGANTGAGYTREMIDKMASLVKEYNLTQPVTFPVEARLLKNSLAELQRLLYQVGSNSTLTVVAQQDDLISVDDLLTIRKAFATNQILFDLPDELAASFKQELDLL